MELSMARRSTCTAFASAAATTMCSSSPQPTGRPWRSMPITARFCGDSRRAATIRGRDRDATTGKLTHVWNSLCSDRHELIEPSSCPESGSAIWGRAGAVIDTTNGDIFVATGNALWDGRTNWGDAVIAIDSSATNILDNYTPTNTAELSDRDADLGSTSPVLLGGGYVAQGGKDASIRLLQFGRTRGAAARRGGETQSVSTPSKGGLFSAPVVLHTGSTTWLFVSDGGGTAAWTLSGGRLQQAWRNGNGGTSPTIAGA